MKKLLLIILALVPTWLVAQNRTEGKVTYREEVQLKISLDSDDPQIAAIQSKLPTSRKYTKQLLFHAGESIYQDVVDEESPEMDLNQGGIQIKTTRSKSVIYQNTNTGEYLESRDFLGKSFLITGEGKALEWKISPETKTILGYSCQKAELSNDTSRTVEVWFCPQIPLSLGPAQYRGLPGLILEVIVDKGQRTIQAQELLLAWKEKDKIEKPTKGKPVNREEFAQIVEDKLKEMEEYSGGGTQKIIIKK